MAYYDVRCLPSPTIRHKACSLFIHKDSTTPRCDSCCEYRYAHCDCIYNNITVFLAVITYMYMYIKLTIELQLHFDHDRNGII